MLKLYNYLTRKKELFRPLQKGRVGLYTCGPTVYNYAHIGNLRTYIFEDVLRRTLEFHGYRVRHVMNITDVGHLISDADTGEDKMEAGAKREGKSVWEIAKFYTKSFLADIAGLNIEKAHILAPATRHVAVQIKVIKQLFRKKLAYETPSAVYFHVPKFKNYSKLSRQPLAKQLRGAREEVVIDSEKRHPADFALWFKLVGRYESHVMQWASPWGRGFPGWHIECSAISSKYLVQPFDIHTGGIDHVAVHHTNEIAQSEGAYGKPLAKFWLEGEHLFVDAKKMSKSLGNFYRLVDILERGFDPLDFRYFVLGAHYRKPLNFTWKALDAARKTRLGLVNSLERISRGPFGGSLKDEAEVLKVIAASERRFRAAIGDDLNMPNALAILLELIRYGNALLDRKLLTARASRLVRTATLEFDRVFGLNLKTRPPKSIPPAVAKLVAEREAFRQAQKWADADRIREQIKKLGYAVEDTSTGPFLKRSG